MKFTLGKIVVTAKAAQILKRAELACEALISRHQRGDWGDVTESERQLNDDGVGRQFNLVSAYDIDTGERITVVTKSDRSCTLVHVAAGTPKIAAGVQSPQPDQTAARR